MKLIPPDTEGWYKRFERLRSPIYWEVPTANPTSGIPSALERQDRIIKSKKILRIL